MRKRLISVFLAAIMLFSLCTCFAFAETEGKPVQREHSVEKREFTLYLKDPSVTAEGPLPLFFADGVGDLPYMEIGDFVSVLCMLCRELNDDGNYELDMDGVFDEEDSIADRNLFCLISPVSFSCGNLVPAALKSSQRVTLLGRTSGGGSCAVQPLSTAYGTLFQISGRLRLSFLKNGSFYDIDQGVDPDFYISDISHYYDRAALTDYISGLF